MKKALPVAALLLAAVLALPALAIGMGFTSAVSEAETANQPSALALATIPKQVIAVEMTAAGGCPGLPWQVLAAANVESDPDVFSHIDLTTGLVTQPAGTTAGLGPFSFTKATWSTYATAWPQDPSGSKPSPENDYDATYTLAGVLCQLGNDDANVAQALAQYDSSTTWDTDVWTRTVSFGMNADGTTTLSGSAGSVQIPSAMLTLYQSAATECPGLSWTVLAAIGTVESGNGTSTLPGVDSGANSAGAEGPMQMLPATFAEYDQPVPAGGASPPSPYDATDEVYAAERMLCANGAGSSSTLAAAIYAYNHSGAYVSEVTAIAASLAGGSTSPTSGGGGSGTYPLALPPGPTFAGSGEALVQAAETQLGVPYVWGGTTPGVGLDCSGLVVVAMQSLGFDIAGSYRTTEEQVYLGTTVPLAQLQPGDLLFYAGSDGTTSSPGHVAIYVGAGIQIAAPETGEVVQLQPVPSSAVVIARHILTQPERRTDTSRPASETAGVPRRHRSGMPTARRHLRAPAHQGRGARQGRAEARLRRSPIPRAGEWAPWAGDRHRHHRPALRPTWALCRSLQPHH